MIRMASFAEAQALVRAEGARRRAPGEPLAADKAFLRILTQPVLARTSQPPADVSAMDGYAVRRQDASIGAALRVSGESRAGAPFSGAVAAGCAIRIFTGAVVPPGADHILIQEDTRRDGENVIVTSGQAGASNIRREGLDFHRDAQLVPAGTRVTAGAIALIAAGNVATVQVAIPPRVAVLANGDELAEPGTDLAHGQVTNSVAPALRARISEWGGRPEDLGAASDSIADVRQRIAATSAPIIVSIGGASVGDHDVVRDAFAGAGFTPIFEKVAIKPGKPTWLSHRGDQLVLGLPGNPAAAMVTARLFLQPLLHAMLGVFQAEAPASRARLETDVPATGARDEFLRAVLSVDGDGIARARAAEKQDSSLLNPFLSANILIHRPAHATAAPAGELVEYLPMD